MSELSISPVKPHARGKSPLSRAAAWFAACAGRAGSSAALAFGLVLTHVLLWTLILVSLKAAQDVHFDVAEAFAWGQKLTLGYGKHPPLSGWVTGVWFMLFPATDWAMYLLAMTVIGVAMLITWAIALRVVDRRRALFMLAMLALYPIFNFKGYKYNPDLLQLPTLALVVLAYLHAFEKRTAWSGLWLGLAAALAMLAKYWALTMIGAVGIAALAHPDRLLFLRSKAPWVAIAAALLALSPHLVWLAQVHFEPLTFASDSYANPSRATSLQQAIDYLGHNLALLALPVVLAFAVLLWPPGWRRLFGRRRAPVPPGISPAINIWLIQIVVLIGPVLGGFLFSVRMKTDWGIPLFFLVPLALLAIPQLRMQRIALVRMVAVWLLIGVTVLCASPWIAAHNLPRNVDGFSGYSPRSELARQLTEIWRTRFNTRWSVVVGTVELGTPMTFYSADHPAPLTPWEGWTAGLTSLEEAKRYGFIGVCDPTDGRVPICEAWIAANAPDAERLIVSTHRLFRGTDVSSIAWKAYIVPPAR